MNSTKTAECLKKGESFVAPSGLIWTVRDIRPMGRGRTEVRSFRDKSVVTFSFATKMEVEVIST